MPIYIIRFYNFRAISVLACTFIFFLIDIQDIHLNIDLSPPSLTLEFSAHVYMTKGGDPWCISTIKLSVDPISCAAKIVMAT